MSTLNLLPPPKKKSLQRLVKFLFVKEMVELSLLTSALLGIAHVLGWIMLAFTLNGLAESSLLVQRENTKLNQQIRSANLLFAEAARSGEGFAPIVPKLAELVRVLPADVKLNLLVFDRARQRLTLGGTAQTREALLRWQQALGGLTWIKEVTAPRSQLFQKENISFEITATLQGLPPLSAAPPPAKSPRPPKINLE